MTNEKKEYFGYVDDGNVMIKYPSCSHDRSGCDCSTDELESKLDKLKEQLDSAIKDANGDFTGVNTRLDSILEDAPEEMDTFKEVFDEFDALNKKVDEIQKQVDSNKCECEDKKEEEKPSQKPDKHPGGCHHHHHLEHAEWENVWYRMNKLQSLLNKEYEIRSYEDEKLHQKIRHLNSELKFLSEVEFTKLKKKFYELLNSIPESIEDGATKTWVNSKLEGYLTKEEFADFYVESATEEEIMGVADEVFQNS